MEQPLVSVIIPTYSRPDNIVRAIESVLSQTYKNIETIVVDDNGLGTIYQIETEKVLKEYIVKGKITYLRHEVNKNGSAARNTGFRASHGEFVNFLDDDDFFQTDKIACQVSCLQDNKEYGAAYCKTEKYICKRWPVKKKVIIQGSFSKNGNILKEFLAGEAEFNTSSILFRRNVILYLNGFDESWRRHQDYELMVRFFRKEMIVCASEIPLVVYDNSVPRINTFSGSKRLKLEERFLSVFRNDLEKQKIYEKVAHKLYFGCVISSLSLCDKISLRKAVVETVKTGFFTPQELCCIMKIIIKIILNKLF